MNKDILKNEILAPAGSIESLYASINAGADAVYIGGQRFGARAYAENPDTEDLLKAMDFVHLHNKKMYLTVNTLLKNNEIENELYEYLLPLYKNGLDAVIVQDIGVFEFIKQNFKNMDIHASTQMAVTGVESAKLLKNMGASRIVTARELSLNEIEEINKNVDIEIESFIHGAMCYSYSGLCLFSSIIGGRSGNRGRCAGPCRQPYEVLYNNKRVNDENSLYALSLRDMNTLEIIPKILNCGVYSLKIEGRMKSPEYAALVVSVYRKYVDLFNEKGIEGFKINEEDIRSLNKLYSRSGSNTGYYNCHNSKNMISRNKPAYKNDDDRLIHSIHEKYCISPEKIKAKAEVYIEPNKCIEIKIIGKQGSIHYFGDEAGVAINKPLDKDAVLKQISKTGDSFFELTDIDVNINGNAFVPVSKLNNLRREGINAYQKLLLDKYRRQNNNKEIFKDNNICKENVDKGSVKNQFKISVQISTKQQLDTILLYDDIKEIHISTDMLSVDEVIKLAEEVSKRCGKCYINMPRIFRESGKKYIEQFIEKIDENLYKKIIFSISNIDEFGYIINNNIKNFVIDNSLYAFNSYSKEFLYNSGAKKVTLPYELNNKELKKLCDKRDEVVVYGYIPLMVSAGCVVKNYVDCKGNSGKAILLKDRLGANFKVVNCCNFCYNVIYNNLPMSLIGLSDKVKGLNSGYIILNFSFENQNETREIIDKIIDTFIKNSKKEDIKAFTRGHFNRGVE